MVISSIINTLKPEPDETTINLEEHEPINWFHGQNPLRDERKRMERTNRVDFPNEWESEVKFGSGEKALIERKIEEIEDYLSETNYNLPKHRDFDVKLLDKESEPSSHHGRYDDRSPLNTPLHSINPDFDNFDSGILASILHEHGHDIYRETIQDNLDTIGLFDTTLNEFVAELTMLQFMPDGYNDDYDRNPFGERNSGSFEGLSEAFDSNLREDELELVKTIESELNSDNTDYEDIEEAAEGLNTIKPMTGPFNWAANSDEGMRTNMFLNHFAISEDGDTVQDIIEKKRNVKKMAEYMSNFTDSDRTAHRIGSELLADWNECGNYIYDPSKLNPSYRWRRQIGEGVEQFLLQNNDYREIAEDMIEIEEDSSVEVMSDSYGWKNSWDWSGPGGERWLKLNDGRNTLGADIIIDNGLEIAEFILSNNLKELNKMINKYKETLEKPNGNIEDTSFQAQYLVDSTASHGIEYGNRDNKWDEYFDFPHNVGCGLAHRLYEKEDVELKDVIENPRKYLKTCRDEIYDVMETRIQNPSGIPIDQNPYQ